MDAHVDNWQTEAGAVFQVRLGTERLHIYIHIYIYIHVCSYCNRYPTVTGSKDRFLDQPFFC